jgi:AP-1 complex subunit gamma-1
MEMSVLTHAQPPPARLRLRLKISYTAGGGPVAEQVDWSEPT